MKENEFSKKNIFFRIVGSVFKRAKKTLANIGGLLVIALVLLSGIGMYAHANGFFSIDEAYYTKDAYLKLISGDFGSHTSVSSYVADQYLTEVAFSVYFGAAITAPILFWFLFQLIVSVMTNSKVMLNATKMILLLLIVGLLNTPLIKTTTSNGLSYKKPTITYLFEEMTGSVVEQADKMSHEDYEQLKEVPEVKLAPELAYYDFYNNLTKLMLKTDLTKDREYVINISEFNGKYEIKFLMGGKEVIMSMSSNTNLNAEAYNLGIDLKKLEQDYVVNVFKDVVANAIKVKNALKNIEVSEQSSSFTTSIFQSGFGQESDYPMVYTEYCDNLFDSVNQSMNEYGLNEFIEVSSMCASRRHMIKYYASPFYNYDAVMNTNTELNRGHVALFGNNNASLKLSTDDIVESTVLTCKSGGYLACTHAVAFAAFEDRVRNLRVGLLTSLVRMIAPITQDLSSADGLQRTRRMTMSNKLSSNFVDLTSKNIIDTISLSSKVSGAINGNVDGTTSVIDISKFNTSEFTSDKIVKTLIGKDTVDVWGRLTTCTSHPSQIKNGYRCLRPSTELTNAAIGFGQMSMRAYILSKLISSDSVNNSDKFGYGKKLMGDKSNLIMASVLAYESDTPFIDSPYYGSDTINNMMIARLILAFADPNGASSTYIADLMNNIATVFGLISISILLFVYSIPMTYFKKLFDSFKELLVRQIIAPLTLSVDAINGDITVTFKLYVKAILMLLIFTSISIQGIYYADLILTNVMSSLMTSDVLEYQSVTHLTSTYPQKLLAFVLSAFICLKSLRHELDEVQKMAMNQ